MFFFTIAQPFEKIVDKLNTWLDAFVDMIPNMAVALLLLIFFFFLSKGGKKICFKLFSKTTANQALPALFATIVQYTILGLGLFIILGILKLDKAVTSLLAGVGVVGLALGFAFQDIAANFIAGVILAFRQPYRIGDVVEVQGVMGKVVRTNLRVATILTFQGQEVYMPNKIMLQNPITNYSINAKRRVDLAVGISYSDDLAKVESLVKGTITNLDGVIDPDNLVFDYQEFGDSSINFNIRFWIEYPGQPGFLAMRNGAIKAIKKAFDENDITIPFPIRTIDFNSKTIEDLSSINSSTQTKNTSAN